MAPKDRDYDYGLNDPDDGHVAHAALLGKADAICHRRHPGWLQHIDDPHRRRDEIVYPHEFAANSVAAHPQAGVRALRAMSQRMTTPTRSPQELLAELRDRYGMDEVAAILVPELSRLSQ
jgi:hypothetical protein